MFLFGVATLAGERVEKIDTRLVEGKLLSVDARQVVMTVGGKKQALPLEDVWEITLAEVKDASGQTGRGMLTTTAGESLTFTDLTAADGRVRFNNAMIGRAELPISAVANIYFPSSRLTPDRIRQKCRELPAPSATEDMLVVVKQADDWLSAEGILKSIDAGSVTFACKDADYKVEREKVRAIRMAASATSQPATAGTLTGRDGSTLGFTLLTLGDGAVRVRTPVMGDRIVKRAALASIRFISDRVTNLADLTPESVTERGFFETVFPHRKGLSAGGRPMRLGGRVFSRGLGLHSFCELTYRLDGAYTRFVAVVGIDDAVRPIGDATLTFIADGKNLADPIRLTGKTKPRTVRLDLTGVKKLTIRVDFGPDGLDAGDHVNLAVTRLLK